MYTVSKGPSKIVAKTRRGLAQNYEKFETIKESSKKSTELTSPEKNVGPRPVFQTYKKTVIQTKAVEEAVITPQHEEIIKYINDSWNIIVAQNPYDAGSSSASSVSSDKEDMVVSTDTNNNSSDSAATILDKQLPPSTVYCVEPPSPMLSDFKPFDLESWWGRRLFNNITKSL